MATAYAIDAPHTLFSLPRPLDAVAGKTLTGASYTVEGSKKRKRSEIVAGVDGESINVYDIKTPRLLTSHAIPPQTYLTARPSCAQSRSTSSRPAERYTYAALRNELSSSKHEVVCFREALAKSSRDAAAPASSPVKTSISLGSHDNVVIFAEPVIRVDYTDETFPHEVVAVQENGDIVGLSADLEHEKWRTAVPSSTTSDRIHVKHVSIQSVAMASKGILKGREDLVALFDPTGQKDVAVLERTSILCLITSNVGSDSSNKHQYIHVLAAKPTTLSSYRARPLESLVRWQLPGSQDSTATPAITEYNFDHSSGMLFQLANGSLTTYSFSALGPKVTSKLQIPQGSVESFLPAPHSLAIVASQTYCSLFNMRYTSLQARVDLNDTYIVQSQSRKRKHNSTEGSKTSIRLIDFYPRDNLVAGILNNDLVILSLRLPTVDRKRSGDSAGRLIDSIGKGVPRSGQHTRIAPVIFDADAVSNMARTDPSLEQLSQKVNQGKIMALTGTTEALKHLLRSFNTPTPKAVPQTHLLTNGTSNNESESLESTFDAEEAALNADLALASSLLSPGVLAARASALKSIISRLGITFATPSVSQALRQHLERQDILFLIELLRLDLERGGWTSRSLDIYPDTPKSTSNSNTSKHNKGQDAAISVVCKVLNCALDALGMGAWVAHTHANTEDEPMHDDDDEETDVTHHTISLLRAETEAVLECVQESAFFTGFLGEFLRYERAVVTDSDNNYHNHKSHKTTAQSTAAKGAIIMDTPRKGVVNVQGGLDAPLDVQRSMLPVGVRAAKGVSKTRIGAGGEVQRNSKRNVGNEISKRVGVYSFERLRV